MKNKWVKSLEYSDDYRIRLFCLPYAGSGASIYMQLAKFVDEKICICPIQLPGRENLHEEVLCSDCSELVGKICDEIKDMLDMPFAIFGYSMGGIIAYELTLEIYRRYHKTPLKLFMAASSVFRENIKNKFVSRMNDKVLIEYLEKTGGFFSPLMREKSFTNKFFPIIRNDYALVENYHFKYKKVPCDIVAIASKDDKQTEYQNVRVMRFFTDNFKLHKMFGSHFFIREEYQKIGKITSDELLAF